MSLTLESLPSFSHIPPQSHEEVLREATFLFQRILYDTSVLSAPSDQERHGDNPHFSSKLAGKFSDVKLTTRLLSTYISVFFRHASLELSERMFWRVFGQLGVPRTARVYIDALERCAFAAKKGNEREVAGRFSDKLWSEWKVMEDSGRNDDLGALSARYIERAYVARIRLYAL
jgi:hypothetical protein